MPWIASVFGRPGSRTLEEKMSWQDIADAVIEAALVCASLFGMVIVALPFLLVLAAIITGFSAP
ncbi:MAG: hypothetical protein AB7S71_12250 [Dongiaceae bacterium]